jgi:hypothetical protein
LDIFAQLRDLHELDSVEHEQHERRHSQKIKGKSGLFCRGDWGAVHGCMLIMRFACVRGVFSAAAHFV